MKTVGAFEAKTHLGQLLNEVEEGESFEIRRRNRPVALLVGLENRGSSERIRGMVKRVRELRRTAHLELRDIHDWINEGRAG